MADASMIGQLQSFLQVTNERATVIASNMANVDTPGFKARDIDFSAEMQRVMSSSDPATQSVSNSPNLQQVQGLVERPDGNNVDVDRESMSLAETQLQYQAGTQLLKQRFHQLLLAINGNGS
jgi:flagellar basal-body rod protein FlgB